MIYNPAESFDLELQFISGKLLDWRTLPKSKKWLFKYFKSNRAKAFVHYYLTFGNFTNFVDRTGWYFTERNMLKSVKKLKKLLEAHHEAKSNIDLETLAKIETGKFKYT